MSGDEEQRAKDGPVPLSSRASPLGHPLTARAREVLLERCSKTLRERALLIDAERLVAICETLLESTPRPAGSAAYQGWVSHCLDTAIVHARRIDAHRAATNAACDHEDYEFMAELFFIPPGREVHSAHSFNQLPLCTRRATIELLLHAKPLQQCLQENVAENQESLVARAREGILVIMQIDESMLETKKRRKAGRHQEAGRTAAQEEEE